MTLPRGHPHPLDCVTAPPGGLVCGSVTTGSTEPRGPGARLCGPPPACPALCSPLLPCPPLPRHFLCSVQTYLHTEA